MSTKDYELIATTISALELGDSTQIYIASMFAESLASGNTRFDKELFIKRSQRERADMSDEFIADCQRSFGARIAGLKARLS